MKKIFFFILVLCVTSASAQTRLATLSHSGVVSTFFGITALQQALTASQDGDVITLSSGSFQAANITKAVSIRGAGMSIGSDTSEFRDFTNIIGDLYINIPTTQTSHLIMEGLCMSNNVYWQSVKDAMFLKCSFKGFYYNNYNTLRNCTFVHCRISEGASFTLGAEAKFINSVINGLWDGPNCSLDFDNCILLGNCPQGNSTLKNCIIINSYISNNTVFAYNCVGYYNGQNANYIFEDASYLSRNNRAVTSLSSLFTSYNNNDGEYNEYEQFELTESAKTTYLGTDGKEVGLYGGSLPYDELTSSPRITKCNVASKSTADGKLSIEIEVKAAEY